MNLKCACLVLLCLAIAGCSEESVERPSVAVRDSAGIQIIENSGKPAAAWEIGDPHRVEIGVTVGEPAYQLSGVRAGARLSDGRIVIADAGSREIRYFDADGEFLYAVGKQGSGPGEFEVLTYIWKVEGDSVLAFDSRSSRVTIFGPEGAYVRDLSLASVADIGPRSTVVGTLRDGTLLARWTQFETPDSNGYLRELGWFALLESATGTTVSLTREFSGHEYYQGSIESSDGTAMIMMAGLPYARSTLWGVTPVSVFIGSNDSYEVWEYQSAGTPVRIIRKTDVPHVPIGDAHIQEYVNEQIRSSLARGSNPDEAGMREMAMRYPKVEAQPAYSGIMGDADSNLWVRNFRSYAQSDLPETWLVYDTKRHLTARVENHSGMRILEIGSDYVLGVTTDDLGVERVRVHDLIRSD